MRLQSNITLLVGIHVTAVFIFANLSNAQFARLGRASLSSESDYDSDYDEYEHPNLARLDIRPNGDGNVRYWRNQIKCIGPPSLAIDLRSILGDGYMYRAYAEYPTVRSLCAKTSYGGNPRWNAGGYCLRVRPRIVVFEANPGDFASVDRQMILLFCQQRCRCLENLSSNSDNVGIIPAPEVLRAESNLALYDRNPERNPNIDRMVLSMPSADYTNIIVTFSLAPEQREYNEEAGRLNTQAISPPDEWTAPICISNAVARFPYPIPFERDTPVRLEGLCNAEWFGGQHSGNLGMVCQKQGSINILGALDFLSHPSWLPSNIPLGLAMHAWCRAHCTCRPEQLTEMRQEVSLPYWDHRKVKALLTPGRGGRTSIYIRTTSGGHKTPVMFGIVTTNQEGQFQMACAQMSIGSGCTTLWPIFALPFPKVGSRAMEQTRWESRWESRRSVCGKPCFSSKDCMDLLGYTGSFGRVSFSGNECRFCVVAPRWPSDVLDPAISQNHVATCMPLNR